MAAIRIEIRPIRFNRSATQMVVRRLLLQKWIVKYLVA